MTKIHITRNKGWFGRVRSLKLFADDAHVGTVKAGATITIDIPAGSKTFYGKMDWGKTNKLPVGEINDGDTVLANARFTLNPLRNLALIEIPVKLEIQPK